MKIDDVIEILQLLRKNHGNVDVEMVEYDRYGYSYHDELKENDFDFIDGKVILG